MHFTQRRGRRLQVGKVGGGGGGAAINPDRSYIQLAVAAAAALVSLWHGVAEQADARA